MNKQIRTLFLSAFLLFSVYQAWGQGETLYLYVSPNGSDTNIGTEREPFRTITGARNYLRKSSRRNRSDAEVILRGGSYFIDSTIVFGIEDGGTGNYNITYRAKEGEVPVISSGKHISSWKLLKDFPDALPQVARGKVWVANLPEGVHRFYTLYDSLTRLPRARGEGFQSSQVSFQKFPSRNVARPEDRHLLREITFPGKEIKNWENLEDIEVFFDPVPWCLNFSSIDSVNEQTKTAYLTYEANSPPFNTPKPYNPAWVENVIDLLDEPGEWVLNMREKKIYYWPVNGSPGDKIYAPQLLEHIRVEGNIDYSGATDTPVRNLHFQGIHFVHGDRYTWWKEHKGWGIQHDWDKFDYGNAMLRFRGAENCSVEQCRFTASGNSAMRLDLYCQGILIKNNLIDHVGHMGILLAGYGPGIKDVNKKNRIINNIIDHVGEVLWHGHAIFIWQSGDNYVANNQIQYCPRKGVGICGVRAPIFIEGKKVDWDEASKTIRWNEIDPALQDPANVTQESILPYEHAKNNLVENNYFYRLRSKIGDGAAMNVSGAGQGNVMQNNFLGEVTGNGMRTDDWQRGTLFAFNIITDGGIVHKGCNDIKNNILYNTNIRFTTYPGQVYHPGAEIFNNIIYVNKNDIVPYKERTVKEFSTPADCILKNNVYFNPDHNEYIVQFLDEHKKRGWEVGSASIDPEFINPTPKYRDPEMEDFVLSESSPVYKMGFKNIETAEIGIRPGYPAELRILSDPMFDRRLISQEAIAEPTSNDTRYSVMESDLLQQRGDEEKNVILSSVEENNPAVVLDLGTQQSFDAFMLLAPVKTDRDQLRTLTVWTSNDHLQWKEIWRADPYHIEMPRRFEKVLDEAVRCRYVKIGLRGKGVLQLKSVQLYQKKEI